MTIGPGHGRILPSDKQPSGGETRVLETFTFLIGWQNEWRTTQPIPQKRKKRKRREGEECRVTSSCQDKSSLKIIFKDGEQEDVVSFPAFPVNNSWTESFS
jgi:hypothetical protein